MHFHSLTTYGNRFVFILRDERVELVSFNSRVANTRVHNEFVIFQSRNLRRKKFIVIYRQSQITNARRATYRNTGKNFLRNYGHNYDIIGRRIEHFAGNDDEVFVIMFIRVIQSEIICQN